MFPGFSINTKEMIFSADESTDSNTEDAHYEEHEDNYAMLDDGICIDQNIEDEYEDFDDEMEADFPEPDSSESILKSAFVDEIEAEHYDSLEDE